MKINIKKIMVLIPLMFCIAGCDSNTSKGTGSTDGFHSTNDDTSTESITTTENNNLNSNIELLDCGGSLESLYAEFSTSSSLSSISAYIKESSDSNFSKLDNQLIRKYKDGDSVYFRVDALGLKSGFYDLKISSTEGNLDSNTTILENIKVESHVREGFAFSSNSLTTTASGAYNDNGILKDNAQVIYVSNKNAKTVEATINGTSIKGLQAILDAKQKGDTSPLDIRILGTLNYDDMDSLSSSAEGLQVKGKNANSMMNLTIEGVGNDATIKGFGILVRNCSNVELRNFAVMNQLDDAISVDTDNSNLWIHNLDLYYGAAGGDSDQAKGDGFIDIKKSKYITVSYNHFYDSGKCCLLDASPAEEGYSDYLTYHHNWFDHSDSRHPRVRNAKNVHIYNNYYDGNAKYGVGVTSGSSAFVEGNYFRNCKNPMLIAGQGTDIAVDAKGTFSGEKGGMIKAFNNIMQGNFTCVTQKDNPTQFDAVVVSTKDEDISSFKAAFGGSTYSGFDTNKEIMYNYNPTDTSNVPSNVEKYAGRIMGGDFKYEFDDAIEDTNYNVINELKSLILAYKSNLVDVLGINGIDIDLPVDTKDFNDVIEMISKLPTVITINDKASINEALAAYNSLDEIDKTKVTNYSKLEECINKLNELIGNDFSMSFSSLTDPNNFFKVSGNLSTSKGSVIYNGETYDSCLKMESATSIEFTTTVKTELILVFKETATIKIDGVKYSVPDDGIFVFSLDVGKHIITKADSTNLFYISVNEK